MSRLPPNPFPAGFQAHHLYNRLLLLPWITTREMNRMGWNTARIRSDVRPFLKDNKLDYKVEHIPGVTGDRLYTVVGPGA
jgi:hypothetical protein